VIRIPSAFGQGTFEREGDRGAAWLARLPVIVDDLLTQWGCVIDGPVLHGGVGVIIPVCAPGNGPSVLKVSFPHPANVHEPDAYAAWNGRSAVRLYARDDERFAMLLERAHTSTLLDIESGDEAAAIAGIISRRLAIAAPAGLPRLSDWAGDWERQLRVDATGLDHPLSSGAVEAALATVRELGRNQPELMVHGDLHATNILRSEREPWLVVDPKGYAGDPAYDAGMPIKWRPFRHLRGDELRIAVCRALEIFADAAELDRERVRRWAQFHAVRAAFWGRRHGFRVGRHGPQLDAVTEFADHLAQILAGEPHP
jgi:streptomycin 6-kinase